MRRRFSLPFQNLGSELFSFRPGQASDIGMILLLVFSI